MIDAHLHAWTRRPGAYAWLDDAWPIARDIPVAEALAASSDLGFTEHVLVQADDTIDDTDALLDAAAAHDTIVGVVGWLPLDDLRAAGAILHDRNALLVGVRSLLHVHPDPALLDRAETRATLRLLAREGLPLDVPDAWPALLPQATRAAAIDDLVVVLDHLGKPPADVAALPAWRAAVEAFAAVDGTVAKVSGLHHGGRPLTGDALDIAWDTALDAFGPDRLMFGSDWPMPELGDGTEAVADRWDGLLSELAPSERSAIERTTAERVYLGGA